MHLKFDYLFFKVIILILNGINYILLRLTIENFQSVTSSDRREHINWDGNEFYTQKDSTIHQIILKFNFYRNTVKYNCKFLKPCTI
jgi:hypothetical protein